MVNIVVNYYTRVIVIILIGICMITAHCMYTCVLIYVSVQLQLNILFVKQLLRLHYIPVNVINLCLLFVLGLLICWVFCLKTLLCTNTMIFTEDWGVELINYSCHHVVCLKNHFMFSYINAHYIKC